MLTPTNQVGSAISFDARTVAPAQAFEPIPSGWQPMVIVGSELKPTKTAGGELIEWEVQIIDGEYKGRKIFYNTNWKNKNPKAVEIGQEQLSALCHATGVIAMTSTAQLHNIPFMGKVKLEPAKTEKAGTAQEKTYEAKNDINGWKPMEGMTPAMAGVQQGPPAAYGPPAGPPQQYAPPANVTQFPQGAPQPPAFQPPAPGAAFVPPAGAPPAQPWQQPAAAPAPAPQPPAPPAPAPAPPAPAAPVWPPEGFVAHPQSAGWYWNQGTGEVVSEADLQARQAPATPPAAPQPPPAPAAPPAAAAPAGWTPPPAAGAPGFVPPWAQPAPQG